MCTFISFHKLLLSSQVSKNCAGHIRRVMHAQAKDVKLMPEIQHGCLEDLGKHCLNKGGEHEVDLQILDIV